MLCSYNPTANIDGALRKMESDMQVMRQETESSRSRIRELELELERARIAASKAQREAEKYKGEKVELQVEVARLEDEKTGQYREPTTWSFRQGALC